MPAHLLVAVLLATQATAATPTSSETTEAAGAASTPDTPAPEVATQSGEDPDRMICRRPEPVLGSRVRKRRLCMTAAQWRVYREGRDAWRRDYQNRSDPLAVE